MRSGSERTVRTHEAFRERLPDDAQGVGLRFADQER